MGPRTPLEVVLGPTLVLSSAWGCPCHHGRKLLSDSWGWNSGVVTKSPAGTWDTGPRRARELIHQGRRARAKAGASQGSGAKLGGRARSPGQLQEAGPPVSGWPRTCAHRDLRLRPEPGLHRHRRPGPEPPGATAARPWVLQEPGHSPQVPGHLDPTSLHAGRSRRVQTPMMHLTWGPPSAGVELGLGHQLSPGRAQRALPSTPRGLWSRRHLGGRRAPPADPRPPRLDPGLPKPRERDRPPLALLQLPRDRGHAPQAPAQGGPATAPPRWPPCPAQRRPWSHAGPCILFIVSGTGTGT